MPDWLKRKTEAKNPTPSNDSIQSLRYVVLDTELTSLDRRTNRLLSIGAIEMHGPSIQLGEQFYRVVNPQVSIPAETVVIHKLRAEDVREGEELEAALKDFIQFVGNAVLVGHFLDIDLKVLQKEMRTTGNRLDNPAIDTARVYSWLLRRGPFTEDLPVRLGNLELATLAKFYNLDTQGAHHALSDAFLTARIWQKMLYALQANRIDSLRKVLRIGGA